MARWHPLDISHWREVEGKSMSSVWEASARVVQKTPPSEQLGPWAGAVLPGRQSLSPQIVIDCSRESSEASATNDPSL